MKNNPISLIECPRDAMQGWPHPIPTDQKVRYLDALLRVGFHTLDFGSFVSPKAIPQMADTHEVIKRLDLSNTNTKLLAIVANQRGAEEAVAYDVIDYIGFPFSVSPTFQLRNTNSTQQESLERVEAMQELCLKSGKTLVVYLSMGFGNPYGDEYNAGILLHWANALAARGISIISLADTVGLAEPAAVTEALKVLIPQYPSVNFGVHLHSSASNWEAKLAAAVNAGCTRFDGALKGIGGCPMAQDELVGNMDTTLMIDWFKNKNMLGPVNGAALQECITIANEIFV